MLTPRTLFFQWGTRIPNLNSNIDPFLKVVGFFLGLFLWALAAMVAAMFISPHMTRISQTALSQPLISGGLGFLTVIILPIILVLLAIYNLPDPSFHHRSIFIDTLPGHME